MEEASISRLSVYLRKMAIEGYIIQLDLSDMREAVRLLRINSNNLNQYVKKANETGSVYAEDIKDVKEDIPTSVLIPAFIISPRALLIFA